MIQTNTPDRILELYWANQSALPSRQKRLARLILVLDLLILLSGLMHNLPAQSRLASLAIRLMEIFMPPFCLAVCCILACLGKAALNDFSPLCRLLRIHGIAAPSLLRLICRAVLRLYRPCLTGLFVFLPLSGLLCALLRRRAPLLMIVAVSGCQLLIWILTFFFLLASSDPDKRAGR